MVRVIDMNATLAEQPSTSVESMGCEEVANNEQTRMESGSILVTHSLR